MLFDKDEIQVSGTNTKKEIEKLHKDLNKNYNQLIDCNFELQTLLIKTLSDYSLERGLWLTIFSYEDNKRKAQNLHASKETETEYKNIVNEIANSDLTIKKIATLSNEDLHKALKLLPTETERLCAILRNKDLHDQTLKLLPIEIEKKQAIIEEMIENQKTAMAFSIGFSVFCLRRFCLKGDPLIGKLDNNIDSKNNDRLSLIEKIANGEIKDLHFLAKPKKEYKLTSNDKSNAASESLTIGDLLDSLERLKKQYKLTPNYQNNTVLEFLKIEELQEKYNHKSKEFNKIYIKLKILLDESYYNNKASFISDIEYDLLKIAHKNINDNGAFEMVKNILPLFIIYKFDLSEVGASVPSKKKKIKHKYKQLSLKNVFTIQDILDFEKSTNNFLNSNKNTLPEPTLNFVLEPKIDGMSFVANYNNGQLQTIATRGDGILGEDVTQNGRLIENFPHTINYCGDCYVYGEIYAKKAVFEDINKAINNKYSNPRNYTAGSMQLLDQTEFSKRKLSYFVFNMIKEDSNFLSEIEMLQMLEKENFVIIPKWELKNNIEEIEDYIIKLSIEKENLPFTVDGIVIKINDRIYQERLGSTSHHPRWAIAYKMTATKTETTLEDISLQVGRTGAITPVAELKEVFIEGIKITRATLHNFDEIRNKDIRTGDVVTLQRAGDVIPQIIESRRSVMSKKSTMAIPNKCPCCGTKLIKEKEEDVILRCPNHNNCKEQIIQGLEHFISRKAFNINGLGKSGIRLFFEIGFVKNFIDIFNIHKYKENILKLEGWGDKAFNNLITAIEQSKSIDLDKFIYALGIRYIGLNTAELIAETFIKIENLISFEDQEKLSNILKNIDGLGEQSSLCFKEYFSNQDNIKKIKYLLEEITINDYEKKQDINSTLQNQSIVFTGTLQSMSREEAKEIAKKKGLKIKSSISKEIDFVVIGEKAGKKKKEAEEKKVKKLTEEEWLLLLQKS